MAEREWRFDARLRSELSAIRAIQDGGILIDQLKYGLPPRPPRTAFPFPQLPAICTFAGRWASSGSLRAFVPARHDQPAGPPGRGVEAT